MAAVQAAYANEAFVNHEVSRRAAKADWALAAMRHLGYTSRDHSRVPASRLLIVDDHMVVREGLRSLLKDNPSVDVIGDAADGHEALAACRKMQPDIVVMGLQLPSLDGIDATRMIRRRWPDIRIVVLTGTLSESRAAGALNAGAHGYVLKQSGLGKFNDAITAVRAGLPYIDPALNVAQINALRNEAPEKTATPTSTAALTGRERQILKLIAEGNRNREIAQRLTISQKTVETHRLNMMQKLDAHNVAELVQWACRLGLMSL